MSDAKPFDPTAPIDTAPAFSAVVRFIRHLLHPDHIAFNLAVAAVVGAVTTGFTIIIVLMLLVGTNCNLLGAIE